MNYADYEYNDDYYDYGIEPQDDHEIPRGYEHLDDLPSFESNAQHLGHLGYDRRKCNRYHCCGNGYGWKHATKADCQFDAGHRKPKRVWLVKHTIDTPDQGDYAKWRTNKTYTYKQLVAAQFKQEDSHYPWRSTKAERKMMKQPRAEADQMYEAAQRGYAKIAATIVVPATPRIGNRAKAKERNIERGKAKLIGKLKADRLIQAFIDFIKSWGRVPT